jgi:hypothetical protein
VIYYPNPGLCLCEIPLRQENDAPCPLGQRTGNAVLVLSTLSQTGMSRCAQATADYMTMTASVMTAPSSIRMRWL